MASSAGVRVREPAMWALVVVTGVGPIATDSYIAALPALQRSLHTSAAAAQLTLTAFIVGIAIGQLAVGPASDGRGRRSLLLVCTSAFCVASLACVVAPSAPVLITARLLQGVAGGGGIAIGRAVVSDRFEGAAAAARYGTLSSIVFLGPVVAPAVGGAVLTVGTWRTVFGLLTLLGGLMVVAVVVGLPETLPADRRHASGVGAGLRRMGDLIGDRSFIKHVVVQCLATAGFFTYIGGSAFVLQTVYRISPTTYALVFASNATAMALTSLAFRTTVVRVGAAPLRTLGLLTSTAAAAGLLAVALTDRDASLPLAVPWVLLGVVVAGMGLCMPGTMALAQQAGRRAGGTAAALTGGLTFLVGAAVTPLTGLLGYDTLLPMALLMTGFLTAASGWLLASGSTRP